MTNVIKYENVETKIINIRGQSVILDSDLAELYEVETRDINKAVKNNPDKFPKGYIIELNKTEKNELVENLHRFEKLKHSTVLPKAFTERGLYMLATILKSARAVETTLAIIDTFAKVREIKSSVIDMIKNVENQADQQKIIEHVGLLTGELIMPDEDDFETVEIQTDAKFKFMGVLEFSKRTIKRPKN